MWIIASVWTLHRVDCHRMLDWSAGPSLLWQAVGGRRRDLAPRGCVVSASAARMRTIIDGAAVGAEAAEAPAVSLRQWCRGAVRPPRGRPQTQAERLVASCGGPARLTHGRRSCLATGRSAFDAARWWWPKVRDGLLKALGEGAGGASADARSGSVAGVVAFLFTGRSWQLEDGP